MQHGEVRIIGGKWRSRKLKFPALPGLRPTPDRVRETVFNWLAPVIRDARCLDLFAGSGALGIEALSRGAAQVTFVEQNPQLVSYLKQQLETLKAENTEVICAEVGKTSPLHPPFNIIFLDPPFHQNLIEPTCRWLQEQKLLAPDAYIYLETESELDPLPIPSNWRLIKNKTAGKVKYHLVETRFIAS